MFDQIIELQNTQDAIYRAALEELQRRLQFEEKKKQREAEVRAVWEPASVSVQIKNCRRSTCSAAETPLLERS